MSEGLVNALKKGTVAVLGTFSEKGLPHTTPIQTLYPKGNESILISLHKDIEGYHNLVWQKKVMISIMEENDICCSILARAGVVRAPSQVHPLMNIVRLDVIEIVNNQSPFMVYEKGIQWSYRSLECQEISEALIEELKELAVTL